MCSPPKIRKRSSKKTKKRSTEPVPTNNDFKENSESQTSFDTPNVAQNAAANSEPCNDSSLSSLSSCKSCSFRDEAEVIHVPAARTLTDDPRNLWYQREDFAAIREKIDALLFNVDENGVYRGKKYCMRGLETYLNSDSYEEALIIRRSILLALREHSGNPFHDSLTALSRSSVDEALQRAESDARVAESLSKKLLGSSSHSKRRSSVSHGSELSKSLHRRSEHRRSSV